MKLWHACLLPSLLLLAPSQAGQAEELASLRRAFEDPLPGKRLEAAKKLAEHGKKALALVRDALRCPDAQVRRAATDAAIAMRHQAAPLQEALRRSLEDPVAWVRAGAAEALGKLGPLSKETLEALVRLAGDKDLFVRISVLQSLAKSRIQDHEDLLQKAAIAALEVKESGWGAKRFAVEILGRYGKPPRAAIPVLLRVLRESPEGMWDQGEAIARLLIQVGKNKQVLQILAARIEDPEHGGFKNSLRIIARLGTLARPLRPRIQSLAKEAKRGHIRKALQQTLEQISGR